MFENPYRSISLFAGAGGTALGFERAGFEHVLVNENNKHAAATLNLNRPKWWPVDQRDIHDIDFTEYKGQVEVIEGGFPCQAFSLSGKKLGFEDKRGLLFFQFARAVSEVRPAMFMAENVRGLLSHDKGNTMRVIVETMQELGYHVEWRILNSWHHGDPQKRERVIIIGINQEMNFDLNMDAMSDHEPERVIKMKFDQVDWPESVPLERRTTVRDAIGDRPESPGFSYSAAKYEVMRQVPEGGWWKDLPEQVAKDYMKALYGRGSMQGVARRLAWDEPTLTIMCNPYQRITERCHPEDTRPLNIRESARLQSFPDEWNFSGSMSEQYRQIGNAVPVNLATAVAKSIKDTLGQIEACRTLWLGAEA